MGPLKRFINLGVMRRTDSSSLSMDPTHQAGWGAHALALSDIMGIMMGMIMMKMRMIFINMVLLKDSTHQVLGDSIAVFLFTNRETAMLSTPNIH